MPVVIGLLLVALATSGVGLTQVKMVRYMSPDGQPLYDRVVQMFEDETGIKVELINAPGSQVRKWEQVITMVGGGISPDLVDAISTEFVQYAASDLIQSYDEYVQRDGVDVSKLNTTLLDALKWQGKQYVMPYGASGLTLVYNPAQFQEAGVAPPPAEWNNPDWNWQRFVEDGRKLTRQAPDGTISRFGLGGGLGGWIDLGYHFGADWVNEDLTRWTGSDEPMIEVPQYSKQDFDWRFAPWPSVGANPPVGIIYPVGMTLLSTAPHKAEAWEFVKFLTTNPEANFLWAKAAGAVPMVLSNIPRWAEQLDSQRPDVNAIAFGEQVRAHGATIRVRMLSTFGKIDEVMNDVLNGIMNENKPARLAMDEIKSQMQALVDEAER